MIRDACDRGAGEIAVNCVTRDGMRGGVAEEAVREAVTASSVPVLYGGGVGTFDDIRRTVSLGVSGVVVGSLFVLVGARRGVLITYPTVCQRQEIVQ